MSAQLSSGKITYVSIVARVLMNVEALNMAETVGNVSRHRKAPVVAVSENGDVNVVYVPSISGESLAYHYQRLLATIAKSRGLPVTQMDEAGYFMKFSDDNIIKKYYEDIEKKYSLTQKKDQCEIERIIVSSSVVADVGGFLYTDKMVKRTSRIRFGYMVPTLDAIKKGATVSYPQLHVRYTPRPEEREQALYYVETASSLYALSIGFNASDVAELSTICKQDPNLQNEKKKRIEAAFDALIALIDGVMFGAKKSRFSPMWDVMSLAVSVSKGPIEFNLSPPHSEKFLVESVERAMKITDVFKDMNIDIYWFSKEKINEPTQQSQGDKSAQQQRRVEIIKSTSHTDALIKAKTKLLSYV